MGWLLGLFRRLLDMRDNVEVELGKDLEIDVNQLDKEWVDQPVLFFRYAAKLADARQELERAKNDFEVTKAELDRRVRNEPLNFGVVKVTEGAIESVVLTHSDYRTAKERLLEAKHAVDVLEAMVGALEHKKKALERLVELYLSGYYSEPRVVGEVSAEEVKEMQKRVLRQGRERWEKWD